MRLDDLRLVAGDKAEVFDVLLEVGQREFQHPIVFQVVQAEAREVADQHIARQIALFDALEVFHRLPIGAIEVASSGFHLDQQDARPEQVDTAAALKLAHGVLEGGHTLVGQPEDLKEVD